MSTSTYSLYFNKNIPRIFSAITIALCVFNLTGWILDIPLLRSIINDYVSMNPLTSAGLILLSICIFFFHAAQFREGYKVSIAAVSIAVSLIGLFIILDYVFGFPFHIDQVVFPKSLNGNRMAPNTALNLFLTGSALAVLVSENKKALIFSQVLGANVCFIASLALIGYLYDELSLYQFKQYIGMAVNTAVCFILLGLSILRLKPHGGFVRIVMSGDIGGQTARIMIPVVIFVPVVIGWLSLQLQYSGIIQDIEMGAAFFGVTMSMIIFVVVLINSNMLNHHYEKRRETEKKLKSAMKHVSDLYNNAPCGYHSFDDEGYFIEMNDTLLGWLGYKREEIVNRLKIEDLYDSEDREKLKKDLAEFKLNGHLLNFEMNLRKRDGTLLPIILNSTAIKDDEGKFVQSNTNCFDISKRKKTEKALNDLNLKLEESNKDLEAFSYTVSHDLRAPLRHIIGFSEKLSKISTGTDEEQKRVLDKIIAASEQMGRLIDGLLNFSRTGRTEFLKEKIDTEKLVAEIAETNVQSSNGRVLNIEIEHLPPVLADRIHIRRVFENLISNAVKYTSKKERAEILIGSLENEPDENVFFVRDNGCGFDMKYSGKLYEVFQRLHNDKDYEGTGIGLATVKRIVNRHGGKVWAESKLNEGSFFYFSIPKK